MLEINKNNELDKTIFQKSVNLWEYAYIEVQCIVPLHVGVWSDYHLTVLDRTKTVSNAQRQSLMHKDSI